MATIYRSFQDCLTYSLSNSFNGEGVSLKIPQTWLLHRKCIAKARDSDWGGGESPLVSFSFGIIRTISLSYQLSYTNDYKLWPNKKVIYCCPFWFFVYHISKYKITMNISLFFFFIFASLNFDFELMRRPRIRVSPLFLIFLVCAKKVVLGPKKLF